MVFFIETKVSYFFNLCNNSVHHFIKDANIKYKLYLVTIYLRDFYGYIYS